MIITKRITKLFLIGGIIIGITAFCQTLPIENNTEELNIQLIYKRWVLSNFKVSMAATDNLPDTLKYIPYNSKQANNLDYQFKYGGISFLENGEFIKHWWNKCGTGNPPNHAKGIFSLHNIDNSMIIQVRGLQPDSMNYKLVSLTENELVLIYLPEKR